MIVGVNRYTESGDDAVELYRLDPDAERRQLERTARVRAERNAEEASRALDGGARRGARREREPAAADARGADAAHCTVGEICNALRAEFGEHDRRGART